MINSDIQIQLVQCAMRELKKCKIIQYIMDAKYDYSHLDNDADKKELTKFKKEALLEALILPYAKLFFISNGYKVYCKNIKNSLVEYLKFNLEEGHIGMNLRKELE